MANYKKAFNFKHGVQVDVDNFVVNSIGNVGIGTSAPEQLLDVYGTARINGLTTTTTLTVTGDSQFNSDVKIGTAVTISNGIVTATSYFGDGSTLSNIVGFSTEAWIVNTARTGLSTTLKVGIGTTSNDNYDLVIGTGISFSGNAGNIIASGIVTATSGFIGTIRASDLTGTIDDARLPDTITSNITGNLTGTASNATVAAGLENTPNINVGLLTATNIVGTSLSVGLITSTSSLHLTGTGSSIGIGTNSPTCELQIKSAQGSKLEITSDTGETIISLGNSVGSGVSSGQLRYNANNLELRNKNSDGNIDFIFNDGQGSGIGSIRFIDNTTTKAKLTQGGNFGLGTLANNPTHTLSVGGVSTFSDAAHFHSDITINGALSFTDSGSFNLPAVIASLVSNSGINTVDTLKASFVYAGSIDTANTNPDVTSTINSAGTALFETIGIGTTSPKGPVDFIGAGTTLTRFMTVPRVPNAVHEENLGDTYNSATEGSDAAVVTGSIIYRVDTGKFRGFTKTGWVDLN